MIHWPPLPPATSPVHYSHSQGTIAATRGLTLLSVAARPGKTLNIHIKTRSKKNAENAFAKV